MRDGTEVEVGAVCSARIIAGRRGRKDPLSPGPLSQDSTGFRSYLDFCLPVSRAVENILLS